MGLAAPKKKVKISHDPNNTKWSRSTTGFGHRIMSSQGWNPGERLGALDAAHADFLTAGSLSHIKVTLKDDTLGLGARPGRENEQTGLDAFQRLLGRLNGKSEMELQKEDQKKSTFKLARYAALRFPEVRFVSGGLLAHEKLVALPTPELKQDSKKAPKMKKVEHQDDDTEEEAEKSDTIAAPKIMTTVIREHRPVGRQVFRSRHIAQKKKALLDPKYLNENNVIEVYPKADLRFVFFPIAPAENGEKKRIHWAPLNIGIERRLQTFVVLCHTLTIAIFLTGFFFTCSIPLFWPLLLPYLVYISLFSTASTSGELKGRSRLLRSLPIWKIYASYFPARLHREEPLPPTKKYIFGYHPHGIISHGAFAAFGTEALGFSKLFPGITNTLLTLDSNFRIPFYREYALALGLASVSRESCQNILSKGGENGEGMGRAITIVIGGARESLNAQPHSLQLVLKRRKGFIKLAIHTGADLVPVLAFGENDLYDQVSSDEHPIIYKLQMLVKQTMGFTIPLFHARGVFNYDVGLMPYRRPLNIVVGRPIPAMQQQNRDKFDDAYIDQLHSQYVQELQRLWDQWKDVYAKDRKGELEIIA
ncbi:diacylglycerol O-acyltransferase 2A [Penicillium taxi]|uniref:diacylglycerol O-acyltransferase 2A n=1 Tax=Penicillium taxi TaxID=168475 RepID=UPI0025455945|nr:diacylglycerol O-acyltransferase 2A [Penicillium taxi]KAJ5899823.1 diacylglycerol O-acyltransferase 2A [Penicillium taxi]